MRQLKITKQITNRESPSLEKYLLEISRVELITAEEEVNLAQRIRKGDQLALEKLTKANLRFVISVAKQYQNQGLPLGDLISEGNLGLIKAAQKFDEKRGFKFISYAVWWIRQAILQALAEQARIVRLPLNRITSLSRVTRAFSELEQKYGREPSYDEVANMLELPLDEINLIMRNAGKHISVDAPFSDSEDGSLLDVLGNVDEKDPDEKLILDSLKTEIGRILGSLTKREAQVLIFYFGLHDSQPLTLEEIGDRMALTRERVRQIKEKAIRRLRHTVLAEPLRAYLG